MKKTTGFYGRLKVKKAPVSAVGSAGGVLLTRTVDVSGLSAAMRDALGGWRKPLAVHDPAKVLTDLALTVALGGDCLADTAVLRGEPGLYGLVGSHATMSRTVGVLARDADTVLPAVAAARLAARARVWQLAGDDAPNHDICAENPLVVDLDATLLTAHSEKENAAPTFKKGFGFHPMCAFIDHGKDGTGEVLAIQLRKGNAGSNTVADHIAVTRDALAAIPGVHPSCPGRKILIRTDGGGGTKGFLAWLTARGLSYSVGFTLPASTPELYSLIPERVWEAAVNEVCSRKDCADAEGSDCMVVREDAGIADFTGLMRDRGLLQGWPPKMRVIVRRERPHAGAQLRFDDPLKSRWVPADRVRHQHHQRARAAPRAPRAAAPPSWPV